MMKKEPKIMNVYVKSALYLKCRIIFQRNIHVGAHVRLME